MKTYKTAIIGLHSPLSDPELIDDIRAKGRCQLCAVFDKSKVKCDEVARRYDIVPYNDSRQLIISEKPDIILLGLPNYQAGEAIHIAASIGSHIFKTAPVARDISEADGWIKSAKKGNSALAVNCPSRSNLLTEKIVSLAIHSLGTIYHCQIVNFNQYEGVLDWRGEPTISGGGVLLEGNFCLVDLLCRINGLPLRVYAAHTDLCKKISIPPYLTEDTATLTLEYPGHNLASLTCGWMAGMHKLDIAVYGTEGSIHSDGKKIWHYDRNNTIIAEYDFSDEIDLNATIRQFDHFICHLDNPDLKLSCSAESFLNTIATINTAYLSATTKSPEEPAKILGHM